MTAAGQSSFLPADAQSTRAVEALQRDFKGGDDVPVLIVFDRNGGLTRAWWPGRIPRGGMSR